MIIDVAYAETAPAADAELGVPELAPPSSQIAEERTHALADRLRCPVCQGLSVADSSSSSANAMKARIRGLVDLGYSDQQVQDYFVGRYGEWVLLEPEGRHWIVWFGPVLFGILGTAWVLSVAGRWRKQPEPLPSDLGLIPKDKYEERLLAEVDRT